MWSSEICCCSVTFSGFEACGVCGLENLNSQDRDLRYAAFLYLQLATNEKVDWFQSLRKLYDKDMDDKIRQTVLGLIETEEDLKYRKKYAGVWKE